MSQTITLDDADLAENIAPAVAPKEAETPAAAGEGEAKPEVKTPAWQERRLAQITRQRHEAERRASLVERENAELKAALAKAAGVDPENVAPAGGRFSVTAEEFQKGVSEAAAKQRFDDLCNDIYQQGEDEFGNYAGAIQNFSKIGGLSPVLVEAAAEIGDAHKIIHALAEDLDEAARLAELPPIRMAAALAKYAGKIKKTAAPRVSAAPPPITPVTGTVAPSVDPEKMSPQEWRAWREAELAKKRR